ncbi:MAG: hypothetical protein EHM79_19080 [Geobacter sp.]|nr:MAG: hypothetical protein EHM79_19080 [Geobacter sp.]
MAEKGMTEQKAELQKKAYQMRIAGMPYRRIGDQLGVSHVTAFNYVQDMLSKLRAESKDLAETYRDMELERLDEAQAAIYANVLKGDLQAIDRFLKIQERRSKYLGLDVATKVEATFPSPIIFIEGKDANKTGTSN